MALCLYSGSAPPANAGPKAKAKANARASRIQDFSRGGRLPPINIRAKHFKWQARFDRFLDEIEPDHRPVIVVVDVEGNKGKSVFCHWLFAKFGSLYGKADDANLTGYLYNGQRECLFDVEKCDAGNIDWRLIEALKNGILIDNLDCVVKTAISPTKTSHVLLFMAEYPDMSQLSLDRWHIIDDLSDELSIHQLFPPEKFPGVENLKDPFHEHGIAEIPEDDAAPAAKRTRIDISETTTNVTTHKITEETNA